MNNHTDTNQASEEQLRKELRNIIWYGFAIWYESGDELDVSDANELAVPLLNLIRTEKLKLLDEVVHQSTANLKSAKAVAGWAELRKEQLEAEL